MACKKLSQELKKYLLLVDIVRWLTGVDSGEPGSNRSDPCRTAKMPDARRHCPAGKRIKTEALKQRDMAAGKAQEGKRESGVTVA